MKNPVRFLIPAIAAGIASSLFAAEPAPPWTVRADHEGAVYQAGETATFLVKLNPDATIAPDAEVFWKVSKDGVAPFTSGKVKLEGGTARFTAKLDEAGFLQARVSTQDDGKGAGAGWGVAFSPEKLKRSLPVPDDFDAFWKERLAELAKIPVNPDLKPAGEDKAKGLEVFDTRLDCIGVKVSGYYARKTGAAPKSLPAILTLHGAGVRSSDRAGALTWASRGFLAMDINAHGIENGKDEAYYKDLLGGALDGYRYVGREAREKTYFTGMFLRAKRALDFLCSQPEWDGKTLVVLGGSQGGFQAFAAAALDDRVTMMVAHVPAGCDHSGMLAGRVAGWPKIVPVKDGKPDPAILEASRYIDNVNFAARCKARKAIVSVGYADGVCPPTGVYVAFNELAVKDKKLIPGLGMGHSVDEKISAEAREQVIAHAKR